MKKNISLLALLLPLGASLLSCQDELSEVGSTLSRGEVAISIDTLLYDLQGRSVEMNRFDSRAATNLLGRLSTPEYGDLDCSYVTRLLPTPELGIPPSIPEEAIDSMKIVLSVPRGSLAGDSLAPQQVSIYRLNSQLPDILDNTLDPSMYFDQADILGTKNYTLSGLALTADQYSKNKVIEIRMEIPRQFALDVVRKYRTEPQTFQWPSSFAQWVPGIYAAHSFGRGCVANVTQTKSLIYYHYTKTENVLEEGIYVPKEVVVTDSVCNFVTSPAVLSANRVSYVPSASLRQLSSSQPVMTSPGGFISKFRFPAEKLLERLREVNNSLTVVANLTMSIPAEKIEGKVDLDVPPYILMVPSSKLNEFFDNGELPDDKTTFWATYNPDEKMYNFTSMRDYISRLANLPSLESEELDYMLVPVLIGSENITDSYGNVTGMKVVSCTPYMAAPTMTRLNTEKGRFIFTFSRQTL